MPVFNKDLRILKLVYKTFTSDSGNFYHFWSVGVSGILQERRQQEVAVGNIILLE